MESFQLFATCLKGQEFTYSAAAQLKHGQILPKENCSTLVTFNHLTIIYSGPHFCTLQNGTSFLTVLCNLSTLGDLPDIRLFSYPSTNDCG